MSSTPRSSAMRRNASGWRGSATRNLRCFCASAASGAASQTRTSSARDDDASSTRRPSNAVGANGNAGMPMRYPTMKAAAWPSASRSGSVARSRSKPAVASPTYLPSLPHASRPKPPNSAARATSGNVGSSPNNASKPSDSADAAAVAAANTATESSAMRSSSTSGNSSLLRDEKRPTASKPNLGASSFRASLLLRLAFFGGTPPLLDGNDASSAASAAAAARAEARVSTRLVAAKASIAARRTLDDSISDSSSTSSAPSTSPFASRDTIADSYRSASDLRAKCNDPKGYVDAGSSGMSAHLGEGFVELPPARGGGAREDLDVEHLDLRDVVVVGLGLGRAAAVPSHVVESPS
mmetsp:Transcript_27729/g.111039  ORF Transcript_27729/g.111039 Transcript_27729/m.111039 type:complete len:353 (+) Transcript_27729:564-1622(+)